MMDFWQFEFWPWVKVRSLFWWWVIKYRGKRHIPARVIFEQMEKSIRSLNENLLNAVGAEPDDLPKAERLQAREALMKAVKLEGEIKKMKSEHEQKS
ncbi:MAG: hypothetical protein NUV80_02580 [Candidatus Berkelbacteria bacterium]|nr:hypothetical protein [Candidatus Berkelbacteria bacterium]